MHSLTPRFPQIAEIPYSTAHEGTAGGCQIGDDPSGRRPFHHYLDVLKRFGARIAGASESETTVIAERLVGCTIDLLDYASRIATAGPEQVAAAIRGARRCFDAGAWPALSPRDRSLLMHRAVEALARGATRSWK